MAELSTVKMVEAPPVHAEIFPSSVSNMKIPGWPFTLKATPLGGATIPVGVAGFELPFGGATVNDPFNAPFWSYSVVNPLLLSEIQNGLPGTKAIPQGFNSLGSVLAAIPDVSETRFVCL